MGNWAVKPSTAAWSGVSELSKNGWLDDGSLKLSARYFGLFGLAIAERGSRYIRYPSRVRVNFNT